MAVCRSSCMGPDIEGGHGLLRLGKRRSPCRVVRGTREENTGRGAGGSRRGSMAVCRDSFMDPDIEGLTPRIMPG